MHIILIFLENKSKVKVNYQSLNLVPLDLVKQYVASRHHGHFAKKWNVAGSTPTVITRFLVLCVVSLNEGLNSIYICIISVH